jgi:hypothetical protein
LSRGRPRSRRHITVNGAPPSKELTPGPHGSGHQLEEPGRRSASLFVEAALGACVDARREGIGRSPAVSLAATRNRENRCIRPRTLAPGCHPPSLRPTVRLSIGSVPLMPSNRGAEIKRPATIAGQVLGGSAKEDDIALNSKQQAPCRAKCFRLRLAQRRRHGHAHRQGEATCKSQIRPSMTFQ